MIRSIPGRRSDVAFCNCNGDICFVAGVASQRGSFTIWHDISSTLLRRAICMIDPGGVWRLQLVSIAEQVADGVYPRGSGAGVVFHFVLLDFYWASCVFHYRYDLDSG